MSLPSSPYVDILAQTVADGMIECGYWDDCTKEKYYGLRLVTLIQKSGTFMP